jgi:hypothetical protein
MAVKIFGYIIAVGLALGCANNALFNSKSADKRMTDKKSGTKSLDPDTLGGATGDKNSIAQDKESTNYRNDVGVNGQPSNTEGNAVAESADRDGGNADQPGNTEGLRTGQDPTLEGNTLGTNSNTDFGVNQEGNQCPNKPKSGWPAQHECYALDNSTMNIYSLDKDKGTTTFTGCSLSEYLASHPSAISGDNSIEAIAVSPCTGRWYFITHGNAFAEFFPDKAPDCGAVFAGPVSYHNGGEISGMAFDPATCRLYAGNQTSGDIWEFSQDALGNPKLPVTHLSDFVLPNPSEGLAISPLNGYFYNSYGDGPSLTTNEPKTRTLDAFPSFAHDDIDTVFFDRFGRLFGVVQTGSGRFDNHFVEIVLDAKGEPIDLRPIGNGVHGNIEAADCAVGCVYGGCVCEP